MKTITLILCLLSTQALASPTKYEVLPVEGNMELVRMPEIKAIIVHRTETAQEARDIAETTDDCQAFWDRDGSGVVICGAKITGTLTAVGFDSD